MKLNPVFRKLALASVMAGALMTSQALAQAPAGADKVVVKVNGEPITAGELRLAANEMLPFLGNVPRESRLAFIARALVERKLLAQAAVREGLGDSDSYKRLMRFFQQKALYDAYLLEKVIPQIKDEDVRKVYEAEAAKVSTDERARARHIVVAQEDEAKSLSEQLKKGANFEELATKYNIDGSKRTGGDLGYFTAKEMVPEFSQAVFALKKGEVSGPVKTQMGWHIIRLEDRRPGGPPPFETVKGAYRQKLREAATVKLIAALSKDAKIEILDPQLKRLERLAKERQQGVAAGGAAAVPLSGGDTADGTTDGGGKSDKAD